MTGLLLLAEACAALGLVVAIGAGMRQTSRINSQLRLERIAELRAHASAPADVPTPLPAVEGRDQGDAGGGSGVAGVAA